MVTPQPVTLQPAGTVAVPTLALLAGAALILILVVVSITTISMALQSNARTRRAVRTADDAVRASLVVVGVNEEMIMPWVERGDSPSIDDLTEVIRLGGGTV
jgi:hypothetical protein